MANMSENGQHQTAGELYCANVHAPHHDILIAAFNIFLSFVASLGNILILIALRKESNSLHPSSKLMFRCLAITDLCVGLTTQPMFAAELIFDLNELRQLCYSFSRWGYTAAVVFSGVSLMTVTAISVDRLLALSLGLRYRHVATQKRVGAVLIFLWFVCVAASLLQQFWNFIIVSKVISAIIILCLITSVYCYTKIFLRLRHHQLQIQYNFHQEQLKGGGIPLNIARYRKTVSAALWVQIILVACYLPEASLMPLESLCSLSRVSYTLGIKYTSTLLYLNSSLNPFLYCWKIREVRQAVKNILSHYFC